MVSCRYGQCLRRTLLLASVGFCIHYLVLLSEQPAEFKPSRTLELQVSSQVESDLPAVTAETVATGAPETTQATETRAPRAPRALPVRAPVSLRNKNLILAGDSNDQRFFQALCRNLTGIFDPFKYINQVQIPRNGSNSGNISRVRWPEASKVGLCHDIQRNASVLFLFHFGLFSLHPQPAWYRTFAQMRAATHLPAIEPRGPRPKWAPGALPSTDLARWVWPEVASQHLPARPIILLAHSSLWDGMPVLEKIVGKRVSMMNDSEAEKQLTAHISDTNLTEWGWLERASAFIASFREGLGAKGLDVTSLVWRTNPNCPVLLKQGAVIVSNFSKLSAEAVRKEVAQAERSPWSECCLVDWRKHLEIHNESQCDHHHYSKAGYAVLISVLNECVSLTT